MIINGNGVLTARKSNLNYVNHNLIIDLGLKPSAKISTSPTRSI